MDYDNDKIRTLISNLQKRAVARGFNIDDETAESEIEMALLEYYNDRHFNPTSDMPYEEKYSGIIIQLALSSIAKYGAEGERAHTEGGISRTYDNASNYPLKLTQKIIPLAKGVDM
jgi:hypothetical protein